MRISDWSSDVCSSDLPLLLCIDQFEELFTLASEGQRQAFVTALSAMTDPADSKLRLVIAVRADFYGACPQMPWLADRITGTQEHGRASCREGVIQSLLLSVVIMSFKKK